MDKKYISNYLPTLVALKLHLTKQYNFAWNIIQVTQYLVNVSKNVLTPLKKVEVSCKVDED
jgi:hypothetical protein